MGVVADRSTAEPFTVIAPSITVPVVISCVGSGPIWVNLPSPITPPAPGTLITCTLLTIEALRSACCDSREARSQPPPGAAGAVVASFDLGVAAEDEPLASTTADAPSGGGIRTPGSPRGTVIVR